MRKTELKEVKRLEERTVEFICDLCKAQAKNPESPWEDKLYDHKEVRVALTEGKSYPGDIYGTVISFDLCPDCFTKKLIPWLLEQGATATKTEW